MQYPPAPLVQNRPETIIDYTSEWIVHVMRQAEAELRNSRFNIAVTVPSCFLNPGRTNMKAALKKTDLNNVLLVHETLATAADHYIHNSEQREKRVVVINIGAEFTESSALRISPAGIEVENYHSSPGWGGNRLNRFILNHLLEEKGYEGVETNGESTYFNPFRFSIEKARCMFSRRNSARVAAYVGSQKIERIIRREELNSWITPAAARIGNLCRLSLGENAADEILLSGGASETPLFIETIRDITGIEPQLLPRESAARGAATICRVVKGKKDYNLVDAVPHPLSLVISHGQKPDLKRILPAFHPLDFSKEKLIRALPLSSKGSHASLEIFQGASREGRHFQRRYQVQSAEVDDKGLCHVRMELSVDHSSLFSCEFIDRATNKHLKSSRTNPLVKKKRRSYGGKPAKSTETRTPVHSMPRITREPGQASHEIKRDENTGVQWILSIGRSFKTVQNALDQSERKIDAVTPKKAGRLDLTLLNYPGIVITSASRFDRNINELAEKLREYVQNGGKILLLDWACIYLEKAFPGILEFHKEEHCGTGAFIQARVRYPGLISEIGESAELDMSAGAWDPIRKVLKPESVEIYMSGSYETRDAFYHENKPLAVGIRAGKGKIVYTVANEDALKTKTGKKLLEFLIEKAFAE